MKTDIHPDYHPVVFIDDKYEIITRSTMKSGETREIDGVEHFVVRVDISSFTHPFYTGNQRLVDTAGRVERFRAAQLVDVLGGLLLGHVHHWRGTAVVAAGIGHRMPTPPVAAAVGGGDDDEVAVPKAAGVYYARALAVLAQPVEPSAA